METKEHFEQLLKNINRKGIDKLLSYMDESGFYECPCSTKYHLSEPGGLAKHSLNVTGIAISLFATLCPDHEDMLTYPFIDSVVICSLLHDIGKMGQFGKPQYIESADPEKGVYAMNKDLLYVPHEVRSVAIISRFIELTEEEQFAILYHNGLYGELQSIKGKETPLYMILHFADMWASRISEGD